MKALSCVVTKKGEGHYQVSSPTGGIYDVELAGKDVRRCNCEYGQHHVRSGCCHVLAAAGHRAVELGFMIEPVLDDPQQSWKDRDYDRVFNIGGGVLFLALDLNRYEGESAY